MRHCDNTHLRYTARNIDCCCLNHSAISTNRDYVHSSNTSHSKITPTNPCWMGQPGKRKEKLDTNGATGDNLSRLAATATRATRQLKKCWKKSNGAKLHQHPPLPTGMSRDSQASTQLKGPKNLRGPRSLIVTARCCVTGAVQPTIDGGTPASTPAARQPHSGLSPVLSICRCRRCGPCAGQAASRAAATPRRSN